ncbi:MAG: Xaa-Pro peptidase family protein [Alphaproteobacteria bacterium]
MVDLDWHSHGGGATPPATLELAPADADIDLVAVRAYRLVRVRAEMRSRDIAACILSDPVNIRYATGARNMQVFTSRNQPARYLLLTANDAILYEFTGCMHLANGLETLSEVRPAITASFVAAGAAIGEREIRWARETAAGIRAIAGPGARVGLERLNTGAALALAAEGLHLVDAQEPVEMARAIKSAEEMKGVRASLHATETAVARMRAAIRPGISENQLWSVLHQTAIELGGDYCETRLLNAGPRTNPWFQESGGNLIADNELVVLDTDVVGCHGYFANFSRTFHAGPAKPTPAQRRLYQTAHEQLHHNMAILKPGLSLRDYADKAWAIPAEYFANRYYLPAHGVGMTGEYPYLYHRADFDDAGYDGVVEPGMTLCLESYIGEEVGLEGVKLEQQALVATDGIELLSRFPFESDLLH